MGWRSAIVACGFCCAANAQPMLHVDTIRAVQPWEPREEYTFPELVSTDRAVQVSLVNRDLALQLLDVDRDTVAAGHMFDLVWGDAEGTWMPRLNYLSWEIRRPLAEVVEVEFNAEGCGAYCEGFTEYLLYDLRDGAYIGYDSLFTPAGRAMLEDTLKTLWFQRVSDHLVQLVLESAALDPTATDTLMVEEQQMINSRIGLYRRCLDERAENGPYVMGCSIASGAMHFHIARCANHVEQALDDLDPLSLTLPLGTLLPLMRMERQPLFR